MMEPLNPGDTVWIPEREVSGTVGRQVLSRRSYMAKEKDRTFQGNGRD